MIEFKQKGLFCVNEIIEIGNKSFNHFYPEEKISDRLRDKNYWIFLAYEKDIPTGFQISYEDGLNTYLWLLGVLPEKRKRGIGSGLINLQGDISKSLGHKKLTLKTHKGHPEAISLYLEEGFNQTKIIRDYWGKGLDAIYYEKDLQHKI